MLDYEKKFSEKTVIAGIDEVGRGCLAGPLVCACVVMPLELNNIIDGVNDSKKLTPKKREFLNNLILQKALDYSIVEVDQSTIDEINILQATKLGMKKAFENINIKVDLVLTDAVKIDIDKNQENIIKGDEKSYNIACASIIAKVYRDNLMNTLHTKYSQYGFSKNKGYGTKDHIENLLTLGACPLHRKTFIGKIIERGRYKKQ